MAIDVDQLLADYVLGNDDIPIAFFHSTATDPKAGIDIAVFCLWAYSRNLLNMELSASLKATVLADTPPKWARVVLTMWKAVGSEVMPAIFNTRGRAFALKYLRPGWKYRFHPDLDNLFPALDKYSDIPETNEAIQSLFALLDARLLQAESAGT